MRKIIQCLGQFIMYAAYGICFYAGAVVQSNKHECQQPIGQYTGYTTLDADHVIQEWVYRDTVAYDWHPGARIGTSTDTLKIENNERKNTPLHIQVNP